MATDQETTVEPGEKELDAWLLLELTWGASSFRGYSTSMGTLNYQARDFLPAPEMEISLAPLTGALKENATTATLKADAWLETLAGYEAFAPIAVRIIEIAKTPGSSRVAYRFAGTLRKTFTNANGKRGMVRLECKGIKDDLEAELSEGVDLQCSNTFAEPTGCFIDKASITETAFVDDVDANVATLSGLSVISDPDKGKYWQRGYLELDGLRISIRDWDQSNPGRFVLSRPAPASWKGVSVSAVPGCDLFETTCELRWNNLARFNGMGKRMPDYNPTIEDPQE